MKKLSETKKLLVIVDMINGFIKDGKMADPKIGDIIPNIEALAQKIIEEGEKIVFIKDAHTASSTEMKKFPEHCYEGTSESEVVDELKPYELLSVSFNKNSTCARESKPFMNYLKRLKALREIILVGCCTDICVLNLALALVNYFDEHNIEIKITVVMNCTQTFDSPLHSSDEYNEMSYKLMKQAGINVVKEY